MKIRLIVPLLLLFWFLISGGHFQTQRPLQMQFGIKLSLKNCSEWRSKPISFPVRFQRVLCLLRLCVKNNVLHRNLIPSFLNKCSHFKGHMYVHFKYCLAFVTMDGLYKWATGPRWIYSILYMLLQPRFKYFKAIANQDV